LGFESIHAPSMAQKRKENTVFGELQNSMDKIRFLLEYSNLPGPRGNLPLLYEFSKNADENEIKKCIEFINPDVRNSPEEFVGMCGILSYSLSYQNDHKKVISFLKKYASHGSWRIRESVAISIQEISEGILEELIIELRNSLQANDFEKRAIVAGLCEPKLLKNKKINLEILNILIESTKSLAHDQKLDEGSTSLRKALGYGWSVVIINIPAEGKQTFEKMFDLNGKHIKWILKENLKKKRLMRMDSKWVDLCLKKLE
jgi:hypothetical protein